MITFGRLWALAAMAVSAVVAGPATAQDYPNRPIRFVVGFAAGGPTDILARVMAQAVSQRLGQQVVVENRVGAGGNTATESVVKSDPDGYTVLVITTSNAINTSFFRKLPFDFMRDITPVAGLGRISYVLAVSPSLPVKSVPELVAYAKANPGKVNFASAGIGGSNHLAGELFKAQAGIDIQHIAYRGNSLAYPDLISGRIQLIFGDIASVAEHVKSGALRGLAVSSTKPLELFPDLPTVGATIPGYEASAWYGFGVPRGTPAAVVQKLNDAINESHKDPAVQKRFKDMATDQLVYAPADFGTFMSGEAVRWGKAVEAAGVRGD